MLPGWNIIRQSVYIILLFLDGSEIFTMGEDDSLTTVGFGFLPNQVHILESSYRFKSYTRQATTLYLLS